MAWIVEKKPNGKHYCKTNKTVACGPKHATKALYAARLLGCKKTKVSRLQMQICSGIQEVGMIGIEVRNGERVYQEWHSKRDKNYIK